jgi:hypothetical protein
MLPALYPHVLIHRAGPISELANASVGSPVGEQVVDTRLGSLPLDAYVYHPESAVDGIVILEHGKIRYEAYPRMRPFEKHTLQSVSKPFAGLMIGILEARGLIDVDEPVETYLPEMRGSGWEGVPVQDVLDMASGTEARETDPDSKEDPAHPYYQYDLTIRQGFGSRDPELASTYALVARFRQDRPAGEAFEYSSVNTFVLAWLAEQVSGLPYHELLSQELWRKIGAEADSLLLTSPHGAPSADGFIFATLRDVARFGLLFTPSWPLVAAEPIVPADLLHRIQQHGRPELYTSRDGQEWAAPYGEDQPSHNAWQWDKVWPDGDIYKAGWGGQGLHVSPSRDLVIAYFGTPLEGWVGNELYLVARQVARTWPSEEAG